VHSNILGLFDKLGKKTGKEAFLTKNYVLKLTPRL